MPLPKPPELPEDDPVQALRLLWHFILDLAAYLSPLRVLAVGIAFPIMLFVLILHFGARLNPLVSWAADCVPLFFTFTGIVLTLREVANKHKTLVIILLAAVGIAGTAVLHLDRAIQQGDLLSRLDSVDKTNTKLLDAWLNRPERDTPQKSTESDRKENILAGLRSQYISAHNNLDPGILAGTEYPPDLVKWINEQLKAHGEKWQVSVSAKTQTQPTIIQMPPDLSKPQPIEIELYCNHAELPMTIPPHSSGYFVTLTEGLTKSPNWTISQAIRAGSSTVQWPDITALTKMSFMQHVQLKCDITNHGSVDLVSVRIPLTYRFKRGEWGPWYTNPILIAPLLRNTTTSLIIVNQCPMEAEAIEPRDGIATAANDNNGRGFAFISSSGALSQTWAFITEQSSVPIGIGCD